MLQTDQPPIHKPLHTHTCLYLQGSAPPHYRFENKRVPASITYAYQQHAVIVPNDAFYNLTPNEKRSIDVLFLNANAPVNTVSLPSSGSQAYAGLAFHYS